MARTKSISKFVRDLTAAASGKRLTLPVPGVPNLYVRVTDKGARTFTVIVRPKGAKNPKYQQVPLVLDMDHLKEEEVDQVRHLTHDAVIRIRRGEEAFPPPPAEPDSLRTVAENWLHRHVRKNQFVSGDKTKRDLERLVYPTALGSKRIDEIKRRDIVELLDQIEDRSGAPTADHVLGHLSGIFNWLEIRDDDFVSPIRRGMRRTKPRERRRTRVLNDQEIRLLWPVCSESGAFGGIVQILLLTAQRLEKVQTMRWQDIDADGVWTIPQAHKREKSNAGVLPLPQMAIDIIEATPRIVGNDFVFAGPHRGHFFSGVGKGKRLLDEKLEEALKAEGAELQAWVLHSLRHTAKTLMSRARVDEFDSERVLGHAVRGIAGTYGHHDHREAKREALERLAAEVQRIVDPPPEDKVINIRKAAE
jgi:integrase